MTVIQSREPEDSRRSDGQTESEEGYPDLLFIGSFPAEADQVREARRAALAALDDYRMYPAELAVELVSELATNAIKHSGSERFDLAVVRTPAGRLRVAVSDAGGGKTKPVMCQPGLTEQGGRGLWLVDVQAERWGVTERKSGGITVWFELPPEQPAVAGAGRADGR